MKRIVEIKDSDVLIDRVPWRLTRREVDYFLRHQLHRLKGIKLARRHIERYRREHARRLREDTP